jgi:formate dehydrogenase subunit beta
MNTAWLLHTQPDVLSRLEGFLKALWKPAGLEGMIFPQREVGRSGLRARVAESASQVRGVDPFAPILAPHTVALTAELARRHPGLRLAAIVRPCELRALRTLARRGSMPDEHLLLLGVDCVGTYLPEEYRWRAEKWGAEELTNEVLRFAPQGGILTYRYRRACQACTHSVVQGAELAVGIFGAPVGRGLLVMARDSEVARRLRLDEITDREAPASLLGRRVRMRETLVARRGAVRARFLAGLPSWLPANVHQLVGFLGTCSPCRACWQACPQGPNGVGLLGQGREVMKAHRWLADCVECGACEDACPRGLPLTAVFARIGTQIDREAVPAGTSRIR